MQPNTSGYASSKCTVAFVALVIANMWLGAHAQGTTGSAGAELLGKNTQCAPSNLIATKAQCEDAARALGLSDTTAQVDSYPSYPKGCMLFHATLYFNTHATGGTSSSSHPICYTDPSACASTCQGYSCEFWDLQSGTEDGFCDYEGTNLLDYACDCSGCSCYTDPSACASTCQGYSCEYWDRQSGTEDGFCDYEGTNLLDYECDCSGCSCNAGGEEASSSGGPEEPAHDYYTVGQNNFFVMPKGQTCPEDTFIMDLALCQEAATVVPSLEGQTVQEDVPAANDWMQGCYLNPYRLWFNDHVVDAENVVATMINVCNNAAMSTCVECGEGERHLLFGDAHISCC